MEKLVDLAEKGQDLSHSGELKGLDPQGKLRGVYGFSVKTALGGQGERELKIEPFGNIRRESSGPAVVEDIREPLCDVYDEEDHVLVLAEIPGVSKKDVQLELAGDRLTHPRPPRRKTLSQGGRPAAELLPGEHAMGVRQRHVSRSASTLRSQTGARS